MENKFVKSVFNKEGFLVSFYDKRAERESIEDGHLANQFVMYEDIPMYWDAWYVF
jgi:alpha-mannosidase